MNSYKSFLPLFTILLFSCHQVVDHSLCNNSIDSLNLVIENFQDSLTEQKALVRLEATNAYICDKELNAFKAELQRLKK